jgi:hypothetical protein
MATIGNIKTNLSSPAEREARGEGDPGGCTCVVWTSSHITIFIPAPPPLWHLGSLPSRRFAALAGNDNLIGLNNRD